MISFITSPEIKLIISNKNLPRKQKEAKSSPTITSQVKFTDRELELLLKVNDSKIEENHENVNKKEQPGRKEKATSFSLPQLKGLKSELDESTYLCDLIDGAELRLPENEIVERNPVLEKRIQRLKAEQEQRIYNSMTKNIDNRRKFIPEDTIAFQSEFHKTQVR
jgi:hypothetical protein